MSKVRETTHFCRWVSKVPGKGTTSTGVWVDELMISISRSDQESPDGVRAAKHCRGRQGRLVARA
jgi:hypothetical protein